MDTLNLRIYRRTLDSIALLCNKKSLTESQQKTIKISTIIDNNEKVLNFITSAQITPLPEDTNMLNSDTVLLMVSHEQNKLDPYMDYTLSISFGDAQEKKLYKILVYSFGVLPPFEKDDKKLNRHLYGWIEEEKKWAKIQLVKCDDGSYAIPVKMVK